MYGCHSTRAVIKSMAMWTLYELRSVFGWLAKTAEKNGLHGIGFRLFTLCCFTHILVVAVAFEAR